MDFSGFDWDRGNQQKCQKHGLALHEIESLFDGVVDVFPDPEHSTREERLIAIGTTKTGRCALVVFTMRARDDGFYIRPISARLMHEKEIRYYEKQKNKAAKTEQ